jgi:hypothetical protein
MTAASRKAAERQRRKNAGLVRCEVWVKPEHVAAIKALAEKLAAEETA